MEALRPSSLLLAALAASALGALGLHRPAVDPRLEGARALRRAQGALERSQLEALSAHAVLIEGRIDQALDQLAVSELLADPAFQPKLGPACSGLSCFD